MTRFHEIHLLVSATLSTLHLYFIPHHNTITEVPRLRKIQRLAQGHSANKQQGKDLNLLRRLSDLEPPT